MPKVDRFAFTPRLQLLWDLIMAVQLGPIRNAEAAGIKRQWSTVALLIATERKCNVCTI